MNKLNLVLRILFSVLLLLPIGGRLDTSTPSVLPLGLPDRAAPSPSRIAAGGQAKDSPPSSIVASAQRACGNPEGDWLADVLTDEACRFIRANRDRPLIIDGTLAAQV